MRGSRMATKYKTKKLMMNMKNTMKQMEKFLKRRFQIHAATEFRARDLDCFRLGLTDKKTNSLGLGAPLPSHRKNSKSVSA
jgi:hypothetical protein